MVHRLGNGRTDEPPILFRDRADAGKRPCPHRNSSEPKVRTGTAIRTGRDNGGYLSCIV